MDTMVQSNRPVLDAVGVGYTAEHCAVGQHAKPPAVEREFSDFMKSLRVLVGGEPAITKR